MKNEIPSLMTGKEKMRKARDAEFMAMFGQVFDLMLDRGVPHPVDAALRFTLENGTPHYHVSFERAYRVVNKLLGGTGHVKGTLRREFWNEITDRVRQLIADGAMSVAAAVEFVLEHCRASRFFLSFNYARTHFYEQRRLRRRALR